MKNIRLMLFAAASCGVASAFAVAPADIAGTWECRQPGVQYRNRPPILFVAEVASASGTEMTVEVDGFGREVYGKAALTSDQDGWWRVKPAQGQEFMVRPDTTATTRTAAMALRWSDSRANYRCLRLPVSSTPPSGGDATKLQQGEPTQEAPKQDEGAAKPDEGTAKPGEGMAPPPPIEAPK
jgi:hypothetical protein